MVYTNMEGSMPSVLLNYSVMDSIENSSQPVDTEVRGYFLIQGTLLSIVSGFGQVANILTIVTYLLSKKLRMPPNIFIVNLCIADSLFLACSWPAIVTLLRYEGHRFISDRGCFASAFLIVLGATTSIETIGAIATTRYIGIVHPRWKTFLTSWRRCIGVTVLIWIYSFTLIVPAFTGWAHFAYLKTHFFCTFDWSHGVGYSVFLFFLSNGVSNAAVIFCYVNIYRTFRATKRKLKDCSGSDDNRALMNQTKKGQKMEIRLAIQLLIIYVIFTVCWGPYLFYCMFIDPHEKGEIIIYHLAELLIFFNSSVNPVLYLYFNRTFRREALKLFCRKKPRNLHMELTACSYREAGSDPTPE